MKTHPNSSCFFTPEGLGIRGGGHNAIGFGGLDDESLWGKKADFSLSSFVPMSDVEEEVEISGEGGDRVLLCL